MIEMLEFRIAQMNQIAYLEFVAYAGRVGIVFYNRLTISSVLLATNSSVFSFFSFLCLYDELFFIFEII